VLKTKNRLTPFTKEMKVIKELRLDSINKLSEISTEILGNVADCNNRSGLVVDELTKTGLVLNNAVGDLLLAAEGREPENKLDGIDIAGNHNELSLVTSDKVSDVVETIAKSNGALGSKLLENLLVGSTTGLHVDLLTLLGGLHDLSKTLGVLLTTLPASSLLLRTHLGHELEQVQCGGLIQGVTEHVDCRRALETLKKNVLLASKTNVTGPCNKVCKITLGWDSDASGPVLGTSLEDSSKTLLEALLLLLTLLCGALLLLLDTLRLHDSHLLRSSSLLCGHYESLF